MHENGHHGSCTCKLLKINSRENVQNVMTVRGRQAGRQAGRQTDRQADRQTGRQTDRQTDNLYLKETKIQGDS